MSQDILRQQQKIWENHQIGLLKSYFESICIQSGAKVTPQHLGRKLRDHIKVLEVEGKAGILQSINDLLNTDPTGRNDLTGSVEVAVDGFKYDAELFELFTPYQEEPLRFTPLEGRIFHPLIQNTGRFVTFSRLVDIAWQYESTDPGLLKTHISHIRTKLNRAQESIGIAPPTRHIVSKIGVGYSFLTSPKDSKSAT